MVNGRIPSVYSKTYVTPRRPYEKARLDQELKIIGEYGLRNKREVWRVKYTLAKIRKAARELLTLEEKDPKRLFEGEGGFPSCMLPLRHALAERFVCKECQLFIKGYREFQLGSRGSLNVAPSVP